MGRGRYAAQWTADMDGLHWLRQGDAVTQGSALLLLAMSVASWVVIF
jgi:biopolymer transport protein ExbB